MTKQWLNFDEVKEKLGGAEFEIIEQFKNGLTPYNTETGEALPYYKPPRANRLLEKNEMPAQTLKLWETFVHGERWLNILFWADLTPHLIYLFRKYSDCIKWRLKDVEAVESQKKQISKYIETPEGTKWSEIEIRVVADTRVEISTPNDPLEYFGYEALNLNQSPVLANLLERLAKKEKKFNTDEKQDVTRLRKFFKELLPNIDGDPMPWNGGTYKTAFDISFSEAL